MRAARALALGALLAAASIGCGAGAREVVLLERVDGQIDRVRIALHHIETRKIFRNGKRVTVDFASVMVLDAATNTIKTEVVSVGDDLSLDGKRWTVVRVQPGTADERGALVVAPAED